MCTTEGIAIMLGSEGNRSAAKYQADRALFLLLLTTPYRLRRLSGPDIKEFELQRLLNWAEFDETAKAAEEFIAHAHGVTIERRVPNFCWSADTARYRDGLAHVGVPMR